MKGLPHAVPCVKNQRGMTLLEVLVAISVLMLVGFSALQFQSYSGDQLISLQQQQRALMVAQNQQVLARLIKYPDLRNDSGTEQQGGETLSWKRQVEAVEGFAMKRVIVQVTANTQSGRQLAELTGYVASPN